jgi:hypothetical protein
VQAADQAGDQRDQPSAATSGRRRNRSCSVGRAGRAREAGIEGRSSMAKGVLIKAVRDHR